MHDVIVEVTARIVARSRASRTRYLDRMAAARADGSQRRALPCANQAHAWAAMPTDDKLRLRELKAPNIGIVTAYNDMLSAHQPYGVYPDLIKSAARAAGATAQVAGGVPAMCDGITQGQAGMELSLFSRDVIAMSTAIALSHNVFDATLCLGVCDKIVPGLLIGALQFGHLPTIFVPAGPMSTGISNSEKSKTRQLYAEGKVDQDALLASEEGAYHAPGTCTFYGTANSNQMMMEMLGLHLPGAAFVPPHDPLRRMLTEAAAQRAAAMTAQGENYTPLYEVVTEKSIVNALVGLLATGGSTNHTIHLVAIARAAGIVIDWSDFSDLSAIVPLLARVYPNGPADVNQFHAAGGMSYLIHELLAGGFLHEDVKTVSGQGMAGQAAHPQIEAGKLAWLPAPKRSGDQTILRAVTEPFSADGGLRLLTGNLGRSVIKVSAVAPEHRIVEAPAIVFDDQEDVLAAFKRGELECDFVAVLRFQGPRANGMPELHKLTPALSVLQDRGFKVALVTDGRMSGASGKVPAAIHVTPEVVCGGSLGKVLTGDMIRLDAQAGTLEVRVSDAELLSRPMPVLDATKNAHGMGRELFAGFRQQAGSAEEGAISLGLSH